MQIALGQWAATHPFPGHGIGDPGGASSWALSQRKQVVQTARKFPIGITRSQHYPQKPLKTKTVNSLTYSTHIYLFIYLNHALIKGPGVAFGVT